MLAVSWRFHNPISRAIEHIDEGRRDLLRPLTELVARTVPVGTAPAALVSRVLFRNLAPEIKLRLYRWHILRFLSQLTAPLHPGRSMLLFQHPLMVA